MPAKRPNRAAQRNRRPPARQQRPARRFTEQSAVAPSDALVGEPDSPVGVAVAEPTGAQPLARPGAPARRTRVARQPAQVVVANYDYLRRDLRILAVLAPSLVVIMIILAFVVH